jgi:hypothetical protein
MSDYRPMPAERPMPDGVRLLGYPAMPEPAYRAGPEPRRQRGARGASRAWASAARWAALAYLTVPVLGFVIPLVLYLSAVRGPGEARWARAHAAQALNVWIAGLLYDLAAVIMGVMLALDSPWTALAVFAPLAGARWLVTIGFLLRAAGAARRGEAYAFPRWLCTRIARC